MSRAIKKMVEQGWITEAQYETAIIQSSRHGETPGYHLVENGTISDDDLVNFFIRHFSIKFCSKHQLKQIDKKALASIPAHLARYLRVIPVVLLSDALVLGITDPSLTHAIEEIAFHTKQNIKPVLISENDMTWALSFFYPSKGIPAKQQPLHKQNTAKVVAHVQISETGWGIDEWAFDADSASRGRTSDNALPISMPKNSPEVQKRQNELKKSTMPLNTVPPVRGTLPPAADAPSSTMTQGTRKRAQSTTSDIKIPKALIYEYRTEDDLPKRHIAEILASINRATHRDDVISSALDYLLLFANRSAFFTVKNEEIRGFDIKGKPPHREAIKHYWVPKSADSMFKRIIDDRQIHLGPLLRTTSDAVLAAALGGRPRRVIIIPVEIKQRVIGLLYADKLKIEMPPWYLLERLAEVVSAALLQLLLKKIKP